MGDLDRDIKENADLTTGLIVRKVNEKREIEVLAFEVYNAIKQAGTDKDPLLLVDDEIVVLPKVKIRKIQQGFKGLTRAGETLDENLVEKESLDRRQSPTGDRFVQLEKENEDTSPPDRRSSYRKRCCRTRERWSEDDQQHFARPLNEDTKRYNKRAIDTRYSFMERKRYLDPIIERLMIQSGIDAPPQIVKLKGAVRVPGDYPVLANGNIAHAINLAGGMDSTGSLLNIEVMRFVKKADSMEKQLLNFDLDQSTEIVLKPRDEVLVRHTRAFNQDRFVFVEGEVRYPGEYRIFDNETFTLGTILRRAGG